MAKLGIVRERTQLTVLALVAGLAVLVPAGILLADAALVRPAFEQLGNDIDGEDTYDVAGRSIDMSADGETVIVGAPRNDDGGTDAGHARIFDFDGDDWVQRGTDIDGEARNDGSGSSVAMSAAGDTVIIGATRNDSGGEKAGHARIFDWNGGAWTQRGDSINGEKPFDYFGAAVAISDDGETVVVGATSGAKGAGRVRIFDWSGTAWIQRGNNLDGDERYDQFGSAVDISGDTDTIIVGIPHRDNGAVLSTGHVRIFHWDGDTWTQRGSEVTGEAFRDYLGAAVAISTDGETVIVGVRGNDDSGNNAGHARVLSWNGTEWSPRGDNIEGKVGGEASGSSVAISGDGDTVIIGAPQQYNSSTQLPPGSARIYDWHEDSWIQRGIDIVGEARNDYSGKAVAMSADGDTVIISAWLNDGHAPKTGHARVYRATPACEIEPCDPDSPLQDGDVVFLTNVASGRFLDGDGVHQAWNVDTSPTARFDGRWKLVDNGDNTWSLLNQRRTRYLDADGGYLDWNVGLSTQLNEDDRWEIAELDDASFTLRNVTSGRYLNQAANNNVTTVYADAVLSASIDDAARWEVTPVRG